MAATTSKAAVSFEAEGPSTLTLPGTNTVTYSLRMVSGADPEQFTVGLDLPVLLGPDGRVGGVSVLPSSPFTLSGPGTLGPPTITSFTGARGLSCHGFVSGTVWRPQVNLPPSSDSRLTTEFGVAPGFPLSGDSFVPTFTVSSTLTNGGIGTIGPDRRVTPPEPRLSPPAGVRVDIQTRPALDSTFLAGELRRGVRLRFSGTTNPVAPNQLIRISYQFNAEAERKIANVRTDASGQFRWPSKTKKGKKNQEKAKKLKKPTGWAPQRLGGYSLTALLVPQSSEIGPSRSCSRAFYLRKKKNK